MVEVASRELRNDTAGVLRKVEAGQTIVITRRGRPVADLVPHRVSESPRWLTPDEVVEIHEAARLDPTLAADIQRLAGETTADLGPII